MHNLPRGVTLQWNGQESTLQPLSHTIKPPNNYYTHQSVAITNHFLQIYINLLFIHPAAGRQPSLQTVLLHYQAPPSTQICRHWSDSFQCQFQMVVTEARLWSFSCTPSVVYAATTNTIRLQLSAVHPVHHHHHIYFPRIRQKYNQSQINQYIRKAAREAQNSLTGRLCNYWMFGGNNMEG